MEPIILNNFEKIINIQIVCLGIEISVAYAQKIVAAWESLKAAYPFLNGKIEDGKLNFPANVVNAAEEMHSESIQLLTAKAADTAIDMKWK